MVVRRIAWQVPKKKSPKNGQAPPVQGPYVILTEPLVRNPSSKTSTISAPKRSVSDDRQPLIVGDRREQCLATRTKDHRQVQVRDAFDPCLFEVRTKTWYLYGCSYPILCTRTEYCRGTTPYVTPGLLCRPIRRHPRQASNNPRQVHAPGRQDSALCAMGPRSRSLQTSLLCIGSPFPRPVAALASKPRQTTDFFSVQTPMLYAGKRSFLDIEAHRDPASNSSSAGGGKHGTVSYRTERGRFRR